MRFNNTRCYDCFGHNYRFWHNTTMWRFRLHILDILEYMWFNLSTVFKSKSFIDNLHFKWRCFTTFTGLSGWQLPIQHNTSSKWCPCRCCHVYSRNWMPNSIHRSANSAKFQGFQSRRKPTKLFFKMCCRNQFSMRSLFNNWSRWSMYFTWCHWSCHIGHHHEQLVFAGH